MKYIFTVVFLASGFAFGLSAQAVHIQQSTAAAVDAPRVEVNAFPNAAVSRSVTGSEIGKPAIPAPDQNGNASAVTQQSLPAIPEKQDGKATKKDED